MSERSTAIALRIAAQLCEERRTFSVRGLAGSAGASMLYSAAASVTNEERFRRAAHDTLAQAAADSAPIPGLFTGVAGVYAAAVYAARTCDERYGKLAQQCAKAFEGFVHTITPPFEPPAATSVFDVISGWSGVLLALGFGGARDSLTEARSYLVWLASGDDATRWRCPHPLHRDAPPRNDVGLSHGIAGVLAALSFNASDDARCRDAAGAAAAWILDHRTPHDPSAWPAYVDVNGAPPSRTAWCYGTPGIAAALYAAGRYLNEPSLKESAIRAMRAAAASPLENWQMTDHALCHGTAGNALVFASLGQAENDPLLLDTARILRERLIDHYETSSSAPSADHLEGDSGAALALLTLSGSCDSSWMWLYGLEPVRAAI